MRHPTRISVLCLVAGLLLLAPQAGRTEARIALVIGNGAYDTLPALDNPQNDARLIAETLRGIGFEVLEQIDVDQHDMKRAIQEYGRRLEAAGDARSACSTLPDMESRPKA